MRAGVGLLDRKRFPSTHIPAHSPTQPLPPPSQHMRALTHTLTRTVTSGFHQNTSSDYITMTGTITALMVTGIVAQAQAGGAHLP